MTLNPNEAPGGMVAVPYTDCERCALNITNLCITTACTTGSRKDGSDVMFENSYQHNCCECKKLFTGQKSAVTCDKCVAEKASIHAFRCRLHTDSGHSYGPVAGCYECAAEASGLRDPALLKQTLVAMQSALLKESSAKTITISAELSDAYVALLRAAEYLRLTHSKLDETFYAKQCYEGAQVIVDESLKQVIRAGGGK